MRCASATASSVMAMRCWCFRRPTRRAEFDPGQVPAGDLAVSLIAYDSHSPSRVVPGNLNQALKELPMRSPQFPRSTLTLVAALLGTLLLAACGRSPSEDAGVSGADAAAPAPSAGMVTLYTTREPGLIQPLLDAYSADTELGRAHV